MWEEDSPGAVAAESSFSGAVGFWGETLDATPVPQGMRQPLAVGLVISQTTFRKVINTQV